MLSDQSAITMEQLQTEAAKAAAFIESEHAASVERLRSVVSLALQSGLKSFRESMEATSGANPLCSHLASVAVDYMDWMQWALGDLPVLALASNCSAQSLNERLPGCALVYLAGRVLDDYLDRHHLYRGLRATFLSSVSETHGFNGESEALTVLTALLITMQGLCELPAETAPGLVRNVVDSLRRLLIGILMDRSRPEAWSLSFYERLVELKNVDYWRILYAAIDPDQSSPLYRFWCGYYALAQKVNDLDDYIRDESQGRPNLVSIWRRELFKDSSMDSADLLFSVGDYLTNELRALYALAEAQPPLARAVAMVKLGETYRAIDHQGVFRVPDRTCLSSHVDSIELSWHATADEFLQRVGVHALEYVACPACGHDRPLSLFRHQGFQYVRCQECTHIHVNPRLRGHIVLQLAAEQDCMSDPFLETQKIYAEHLCRVLREHAPGTRLLDIGFGSGYLMLMARACGFQVYGLDSSAAGVREQKSVFGERAQQFELGDSPLPWGEFDQVVMNHVLEHLPEPVLTLRHVRDTLKPEGMLYIAVPDSESLQFRVFGKNWQAVHPIAHPQFFNAASLTRLLREAGLEPVSRLQPPALVGPHQRRWMRMFRRMGGDETGELAMLARRSDHPNPVA